MTINQVINNFKEHNPKTDTTMIQLAYDFAVKAHTGQKRKSGEPYIQHCLHTAFVLVQIKADLEAIIAGLLHDIPEDTEYTLADIEKNFGKEIADLVEGITKLSKIKYRGIERYRESLRKMFLAMAQDLRVILIKFADRLHNLRTLESLPLEKRQRIARETLEIYAPIAGLLGIWRLKWQMEDICFKHLYPEDYKKLAYKYEVEKRFEHNQYIQKVKNMLGAKLKEAKIPFHLTSRFKHLYSIYLKLQKKERKFDEIYDVFALRIIVPDIADCYKTLGIVHSLWRPNPERFKDYIAVPKPNGYQALHTTVYGPEGKSTEFQIRTEAMDDIAKYGIADHWSYKMSGGHSRDSKKQPVWVKEVLNIQKETENTHDFIKQIKFDVFHDRIFVFTPKGDVFDLPEGSTPIDFAYYVHSDIGNQATGAMVNDKITTLDQELKNGDLVEIITDKKRKGPSRDWLKFVKTATARNKIKQNLKSSMMDNLKKFIPNIK
ncbi:MAG: RelA/SpoT family protein [Patescibacteria group bacterium]|nr:RelA/SpoT family protein [Patescibacteria group bacterium]